METTVCMYSREWWSIAAQWGGGITWPMLEEGGMGGGEGRGKTLLVLPQRAQQACVGQLLGFAVATHTCERVVCRRCWGVRRTFCFINELSEGEKASCSKENKKVFFKRIL